MNFSKLLSIIVPSYNMEQYLGKCLGSLIIEPSLLQRVEVLVVNDGSIDRTSELAHEFEGKYPGVFKVIDKQNGHYGSCVNAALRVATGLFSKVLDADDAYDPVAFQKWLEVLVKKVATNAMEGVDGLVTDFCRVNKDGKNVGRASYRLPCGRVIGLNEIPLYYAFMMHALAWRTEFLRQINYVQSEGIAYTDTEWVMYPLAQAGKLYYEPLVVYRYLVGRAGQSMDPKVFKRDVSQRVRMFLRMVRESMRTDLSRSAQKRLRNFSIAGIGYLFAGAFEKPSEERDVEMAVLDDVIKEHGADVYNVFDEIAFVRKWRRHRHASAMMMVEYGISKRVGRWYGMISHATEWMMVKIRST